MRGRICLSASPAVSVEAACHPAGWWVYQLAHGGQTPPPDHLCLPWGPKREMVLSRAPAGWQGWG